MQETLYFRGSLIEYWQVAKAECLRYSGGDIHARSPLVISDPFKDRPPMEFEEVILQFLDDYFRRESEPPQVSASGLTLPKYTRFVFPPQVFHVPVTVRAESASDGIFVMLTVRIEKEAYEEFGKSALSRWNEIKDAWQRKGWLVDLLAQYEAKNNRGMNSETKSKLGQVRELRWEYIRKMHIAPSMAYIMGTAKISYATCKTHDPELLKNWKDTNYE